MTCCKNARLLKKAGGRKVWGKYRGTTMNQTVRVGQLVKVLASTSVPRPELISSPCIASFVDGEAIQVSPSPAGNHEQREESNPSEQGWTHTTRRCRRKCSMVGGLFSKTVCRLQGHVPFGHRGVSALQPLLLRVVVEKCRCRWHGVWKLSRKEPSAGYRRWCDP